MFPVGRVHVFAGLLMVLDVVSGTACYKAKPRADLPSQIEQLPPDDQVGVDDMFDVRVFGEPDLSAPYRVAADGTIDFPLAGRVQVAGLRTGEIQEKLRE